MVEKPISISEFDTAVTLTDWSYIDFHQEFIFDDFLNYTSLLSDTAISPYLESWYSVYSRDLIRVPHPPPSEESRRVLVEVLRTEINCKKIRETIQKPETIPERWFVVGFHSKERELKIKSRLFSMLCLEIRLFFNMTEKNISDQIFPYIPYQTMTWNDSDLQKAMLDLSSLHSKVEVVWSLTILTKIVTQNYYKYILIIKYVFTIHISQKWLKRFR